MYCSTHHCARCGHFAPSVQTTIIDVWPSGLDGLVSRSKVALDIIDWTSIRRKTGWAVAKGMGFSSVLFLILSVLLEVTDQI